MPGPATQILLFICDPPANHSKMVIQEVGSEDIWNQQNE